MTDYAQLGKRLVACKHFRWTPGMLVSNGARIVIVNEDTPLRFAGFYPDLSDAATKGCVLQRIKELWGTTAHLVRPSPEVLEAAGFTGFGWALATGLASRPLNVGDRFPYRPYILGRTEEETMVVAMEAAP